MSTNNELTKQCKYGCGKEITYKGKREQAGSTGYYELDTGKEHTYARCEQIRAALDKLQTRLD